MHVHSHSTPPFGALGKSLRPEKPSTPAENGHAHDHDHDHDHSNDHGHDHGHGDEHSHGHSHNLPQYRANSNHPMRGRPNLPPPLSSGHGWTKSISAGGKPMITPTSAVFDKVYSPPAQLAVKSHAHDHDHSSIQRSSVTSFLLDYTAKWPLLHAIMTEKDSRRIFYFMSLNFGFMTIQAFYGYVTDSLGLLSDSVHMFFDCVALGVGLFAAVASKWPPSERFPYGFGKVETLSGFANGIFLVLISVEIMFEAFERIIEGHETKRLGELFIVSTLGLLVNLVGMAAFGHHHHGHDHGGHSHGHSHGHAHDHGHSHDHDSGCNHDKDHDHDHDHAHSHEHGHDHALPHAGHSHSHGHCHDNENMYGIYLHVLADTLGSAAVIVSTILTHFWSWAGWDPLASFLIAVLILGSSIPLVKSSARRLLLTIPDQLEYNLRDTLSGITGIRGVASYTVPKLWMDDRGGADDKLLGMMHVVAIRGADMDDVRERVRSYLAGKGIDITLQVEREGDTTCWCGNGRSPLGHSATRSVAF
ncbi:uncharacterized protein E0L32_000270 [Thyridium curvatum]|uniref:Zinc transporter n=1 Tax=Thyridium curvatum TaxID=1093900 RepID=A0A507B9S8_9PEZI|nr:uncharacterized protein E0L32_000270 [Thyridium curvatum]TPX15936.1 hypothetical protein E0L32_000270 [Thyridium curvatum]